MDRVILDHSKWLIVGATAARVLVARSGAAVTFVGGALTAMASARGLKKIIGEKRPAEAPQFKRSEGMPSSHSCNLTYYLLQIGFAFGFDSGVFALAAVSWLVLLTWRVRHKYHTAAQVAAGIFLGIVVTLAWNAAVRHFQLDAWVAQTVNRITGMPLLI